MQLEINVVPNEYSPLKRFVGVHEFTEYSVISAHRACVIESVPVTQRLCANTLSLKEMR